MADTEEQAAGTVETKAEFSETPDTFVRNWLTAISMATKEEETWCKDAKETLDRYRYEKNRGKNYNILFANTQTTVPALYNSEPAPDIRRRFMQRDPVGDAAATILERAISIQTEMYDFDSCMQAVVKDRQLQGRGVARVRVVTGPNGSKRFVCEPVIWDDYRRGPAKRWEDIPWEAFRHRMTREDLTALDPEIGAVVSLDVTLDHAESEKGDSRDVPDMFKRATVWEIWDKSTRQVYFIAESYSDGPVKVVEDPYGLRNFLSTPRPLYAVTTSDSLVPICEFMEWKPLADEMDTLTKRISAIVAAAKWRGIYDGSMSDAVNKMKGLADGELAAAEDAARVMQQSGIDKAIWIMPVEGLVQLVKQLYEAREQCKTTIYEITGVADILRGSTNANETLGAQQLKAQWGSLRLQQAQRDVQRFARDLYRLLADLMSEQLELPEFVAMTGVEIDKPQPAPAMGHNGGPPMDAPPQPGQPPMQPMPAPQPPSIAPDVAKLLKSDLQREFLIEIETDSTIRGDQQRHAEAITGFIQGFGAYWQGVLPVMQAGAMPPEVAITVAAAFTRSAKLGREVQVTLDEWETKAKQAAQQPKPPPPPDPKVEAEKAKAAAVVGKAQADMQASQMDAQAKQAEHQMAMQQQQQEFALRMQELQAELAADRERQAMEMAQMRADFALKQQDHAIRREDQARAHEMGRESHAQGMEAIEAKRRMTAMKERENE